jgi:hypothetical protein
MMINNNWCFRLEFAASQWLKLVANAEDLFSKLVISKCLSQDEKDQIEHWLCLKQECEECVGSDDGTSCRGVGRVLERIGMPPVLHQLMCIIQYNAKETWHFCDFEDVHFVCAL